jgi:hypothetical protein
MNRRLTLVTAVIAAGALSFAAAQTETPAAPAPTAPATQPAEQPAAPETQPAAQPVTPTINPAVIAPRDPAVTPGRTAAEYLATARELAAQAAVAYPIPFVDKPLWYDAIQNAYAAKQAEAANAEATRLLAELYTTTQWWYQGLLAWREVATAGALDAEGNRQAALAAAKVGYIRLERGLASEAVPFFEESLKFQDSPEVRALLTRAQGQG